MSGGERCWGVCPGEAGARGGGDGDTGRFVFVGEIRQQDAVFFALKLAKLDAQAES